MGLKLAKTVELEHPECASCLDALARGKVDIIDFKGGFDSSEDVCMLEARNILAQKLNFVIN